MKSKQYNGSKIVSKGSNRVLVGSKGFQLCT